MRCVQWLAGIGVAIGVAGAEAATLTIGDNGGARTHALVSLAFSGGEITPLATGGYSVLGGEIHATVANGNLRRDVYYCEDHGDVWCSVSEVFLADSMESVSE